MLINEAVLDLISLICNNSVVVVLLRHRVPTVFNRAYFQVSMHRIAAYSE